MGKNVYAAPRKRPAGKWVDGSNEKTFVGNTQQEKQERLQKLAAQYKKNTQKDKVE
ncbi:MAG: hypothetical protein IKM15_02385 [Peptococcaceae bacterium]|nr:hypothetical protein [Peptococcaceae bacterium]